MKNIIKELFFMEQMVCLSGVWVKHAFGCQLKTVYQYSFVSWCTLLWHQQLQRPDTEQHIPKSNGSKHNSASSDLNLLQMNSKPSIALHAHKHTYRQCNGRKGLMASDIPGSTLRTADLQVDVVPALNPLRPLQTVITQQAHRYHKTHK